MSDTAIIIKRIERSGNKLPDTDRHKCRFEVASETSGRIYLIAFDSAPGAGYWTCSCPGCIRHGQCKHLSSLGLPGRQRGKSLEWVRYFANRLG